MDRSFKFLMKKIFKRSTEKSDNIIPRDEVEISNNKGRVYCSKLHLSIVGEYFMNISKTCDFGKLLYAGLLDGDRYTPGFHKLRRSPLLFAAKIGASIPQDIRDVFMVPKLNKFHQSQNRIKKYQLLEIFICFLLQLLYYKADSTIYLCDDRTDNLEEELRFLLTILGDLSWMLCDDDEHEAEFQCLLAEFEAVANEAGLLVHSLFFSIDIQAFGKMDEGFVVVLNHIDHLKANIMKFLNQLSFVSISTSKTSLVDSFLIVDSLIDDLEGLVNQEDNSIADVKDQINSLHQGLIFLQSSIKDVGSPQPSEIGEMKEPLMRIGDIAHQAEYLIISFLVGDAPLWYLTTRLTDINQKIQLFGTDVLEIIKKHKIGRLKVAKHFNAQLPSKGILEFDSITVGIEDKVINILDQLVRGTERLQVISIFGMPGLGKTTLANKLYNNSSVNYWFDKLSCCVVSQTYQRKSTMADILFHIASGLEKGRILEMDEEDLVEHIYKTLKGRRYLIVMDDIWGSNVWDELRRCFPDDRNGSRILFTTRNEDVAPPDSIIYELPSLSNDQCWELLEMRVFDNKPCPRELTGIGKKIAANCGGLPLAVVVVAGILSTMDRERNTWKEVQGSLASYIFDGNNSSVMQILELSYKNLPQYLKPCFLYFGVFSEDAEIQVRNLTRLWIAEGFIHKEIGKSAENVAEEHLMELIDKSLVTVTKRRSDGGVKTCVIHDLWRELCLKKSKEDNFLKFMEDNIYSMYEKGYRLLALEQYVSSSYCQYVRSFHFSNLNSPTFFVRNWRLLRVLSCNRLDTHITGIEYLSCLRFLVIGELPAEIGSLVNLEYLLVETRRLVHLPPAILKMKKLRYMHIGSGAIYGRHCTSSSQTNKLEFLCGVIITDLRDEELLKCSPHLRKLKLWADRDVDLSSFTQLESLKLGTYKCEIENIGFPSNVRKLTLSSLGLHGEKMSMIGWLENLEVLKLRSISFEVNERWDTRDGEFQKLRFLKLDKMINLTEWNVDSSQHFPKLQQLVLWDCYYLEEIPCEIGEIATLQLIEVRGYCCTGSLVESARRIQREQSDMGNEELKVIIGADAEKSHLFEDYSSHDEISNSSLVE